ncbi:MAG TPA: hypothetical protein VGJ93_00475 [Desulfuromonadaceae bacterium]|jgi:hypothetical protein
MRRITVMLFALAGGFLLLMTGCNSDPVKKDIISYSKTVIPIINNFDDVIGKKLDEVSKEKDKNVFMKKTKGELLPILKDFREKVVAVKPASKELQDVHNLYVDMVNTTESGMKLLVESLEKQDHSIYKVAMDKINAGQDMENKYKSAFKELATKHGVVLEQ